jgi:precorrin-6B methylase 2
MRVLDIGCGTGDVTCLVSNIVGSNGEVVGIDMDKTALSTAYKRVQEKRLSNIEFIQTHIEDIPDELGKFNAIVGRRVLMYQPDAVHVVKRLAEHLDDGGRIVLQESDSTMTPASLVPMPIHQQVQTWIWETVASEGGDIHMGMRLYSVLTQAGLFVEDVRAEAVVQTPNTPDNIFAIARAMLPRIVEHRVASEDEIDIDTLESRLETERKITNTIFVRDMMFGAWAVLR